jgi:sugar phosphate permease
MGFDQFRALLVCHLLYPVWGISTTGFACQLLSLASLIWGATTWLSSVVKTYPQFLVTRSSTGIDDSSYPGMYSLVADYFGPGFRSKVYGLLNLAQPIGYLAGMILALMVADKIGGWRSVFYITGTPGLVVAVLIYFGVKEMPRSKAEPGFEEHDEISEFRFSGRLSNRSEKNMWFVFCASVFPWNVIHILLLVTSKRKAVHRG